jgi:hypothetical protein
MQSEWVFFDGDCGPCQRWPQLVVKHDHDGRGETFRSLVAAERRLALPSSILVLTTDGRILSRSSAVLHILGATRRRLASDGRLWAHGPDPDPGGCLPVRRSCAAWTLAGAGLSVPCCGARVARRVWTVSGRRSFRRGLVIITCARARPGASRSRRSRRAARECYQNSRVRYHISSLRGNAPRGGKRAERVYGRNFVPEAETQYWKTQENRNFHNFFMTLL